MTARVPVARIGKPRGARGQMWIEPYRDDLDSLLPGTAVWLDGAAASAGPYGVEDFFRYEKGAVLALAGVKDPDAALALSGAEVLVAGEKLPPDPPGTFDADEVQGYEVRDIARGTVGRVRGVVRRADYWVFEVETPSGAAEVPAVTGLGVEVRREEKAVLVDLPPGWPGVDEEAR